MLKKFQEAVSIVKKLQKAGFKAYFAGGCVRDMLLNKQSKDFDISTSALPNKVLKLFPKTITVGKQFGVIKIIGKHGDYDIATFRIEEEYKDRRRPQKVSWTNEKEDVKRRDFTINSLLYNPISKKVLDYVGGQKDIKGKTIKFIGKPEERISEDYLRIIRAVRFKNTLGFEYEPETKMAIKKYAEKILEVSPERVKTELDIILGNENRDKAIVNLSELDILKYILPEIEKMKGSNQPSRFHAEGDVFTHTVLSLQKLPKDASKEVVWATLLHDIGKPDTYKIRTHPKYGRRITFYGHVELGARIASKICERLKFSKKEKDTVVFLVREHLKHKDIMKMKVARQRKWAQHPLFLKLMQVWKADGEASFIGRKAKIDLSLYNYAKKLYETEQKRPRPPKPLLNGNDIMRTLKIPEGPAIGKILKELEEAQLEDKIKDKRQALGFIRGLK